MIIETKICIKCGQKKEINNFRLRKDTGKYRNMCKDCEKKYKHENYTKNKEKILEKNKIYAKKNKEKINKYKKEWEFNNPEKVKEARRKYRGKNIDIIRKNTREKRKINYAKNKEKEIASVKKYYQKNKQKINFQKNEYEKERRKNDILYMFKSKMRIFIWKSLKRKNFIKNKKTSEILGCDLEYFANYLLQTFKNNYGYEWGKKEPVHIDHIIPLATAKTEEEVIKLCHYTNLQLLKAEDNLQKGDKLNWELPIKD